MTDAMQLDKPVPVGGTGRKSTGWWGVWTLVVTEGSLFGYLLLSYFYSLFQTEQSWPPEGPPDLFMPSLNTVLLLSSSVCVWLAERALRHGRRRNTLLLIAMAIVLGTAFVLIQVNEWAKKDYGLDSDLYGSLYFTITGFHMAHVVIGLIILSLLFVWAGLGYFTPQRRTAMTIGGLYWHFVDAVWIFIYSSFFLVPYWPRG